MLQNSREKSLDLIKFSSGFLALGFLTYSIMCGYSIGLVNKSNAELENKYKDTLLTTRISKNISDVQSNSRGYVVYGNTSLYEQALKHKLSFKSNVETLARSKSKDSIELSKILDKDSKPWLNRVNKLPDTREDIAGIKSRMVTNLEMTSALQEDIAEFNLLKSEEINNIIAKQKTGYNFISLFLFFSTLLGLIFIIYLNKIMKYNTEKLLRAHEINKKELKIRKDFQMALQEALDFHIRVIDSGNEAKLVINSDGLIIFSNKKSTLLLGETKERLEGSKIDEFMFEEDEESLNFYKKLIEYPSDVDIDNLRSYTIRTNKYLLKLNEFQKNIWTVVIDVI